MSLQRANAAEQAEAQLERQAAQHAREILAKIYAVFGELDVGDIWNVSCGGLVFWIRKTGTKSIVIHSGSGSYLVQIRNRIITRLREKRYKVAVSNQVPPSKR